MAQCGPGLVKVALRSDYLGDSWRRGGHGSSDRSSRIGCPAQPATRMATRTARPSAKRVIGSSIGCTGAIGHPNATGRPSVSLCTESGNFHYTFAQARSRLREPVPIREHAALAGLRGEVEAEGGSLRIVHGPPEVLRGSGAWGAAGQTHGLVAGILQAFDPQGTLPAERFTQ